MSHVFDPDCHRDRELCICPTSQRFSLSSATSVAPTNLLGVIPVCNGLNVPFVPDLAATKLVQANASRSSERIHGSAVLKQRFGVVVHSSLCVCLSPCEWCRRVQGSRSPLPPIDLAFSTGIFLGQEFLRSAAVASCPRAAIPCDVRISSSPCCVLPCVSRPLLDNPDFFRFFSSSSAPCAASILLLSSNSFAPYSLWGSSNLPCCSHAILSPTNLCVSWWRCAPSVLTSSCVLGQVVVLRLGMLLFCVWAPAALMRQPQCVSSACLSYCCVAGLPQERGGRRGGGRGGGEGEGLFWSLTFVRVIWSVPCIRQNSMQFPRWNLTFLMSPSRFGWAVSSVVVSSTSPSGFFWCGHSRRIVPFVFLPLRLCHRAANLHRAPGPGSLRFPALLGWVTSV